MRLENYFWQHAIKNIGRKVLNLNSITFNKQLSCLIERDFEYPTFIIADRYRKSPLIKED
mgnify:FL=1